MNISLQVASQLILSMTRREREREERKEGGREGGREGERQRERQREIEDRKVSNKYILYSNLTLSSEDSTFSSSSLINLY